MRDRSVVASRNDGVPSEIFTSDTARMQAARMAELQELSADDAIPTEMMSCGETTRIDQTALTTLIEKSQQIPVIASGTPKQGLPQLADFGPAARGSSHEFDVEEAPVSIDVVAPAPRTSRLRDVLIGGGLSIAAMVAWYCATQL